LSTAQVAGRLSEGLSNHGENADLPYIEAAGSKLGLKLFQKIPTMLGSAGTTFWIVGHAFDGSFAALLPEPVHPKGLHYFYDVDRNQTHLRRRHWRTGGCEIRNNHSRTAVAA
jgi:hypothetical protein